MPRSPIRDKTLDVIADDGSVLVSVAQGEQIHMTFTLDWVSDLTGYTISSKVVEAKNLAGDGESVPTQEDDFLKRVTDLTIIDDVTTDNTFKVVIPSDLSDSWDVQPSPDDPVYGFFALSIADDGVGSAQQVFVPVRGLIEVRYNPLETA